MSQPRPAADRKPVHVHVVDHDVVTPSKGINAWAKGAPHNITNNNSSINSSNSNSSNNNSGMAWNRVAAVSVSSTTKSPPIITETFARPQKPPALQSFAPPSDAAAAATMNKKKKNKKKDRGIHPNNNVNTKSPVPKKVKQTNYSAVGRQTATVPKRIISSSSYNNNNNNSSSINNNNHNSSSKLSANAPAWSGRHHTAPAATATSESATTKTNTTTTAATAARERPAPYQMSSMDFPSLATTVSPRTPAAAVELLPKPIKPVVVLQKNPKTNDKNNNNNTKNTNSKKPPMTPKKKKKKKATTPAMHGTVSATATATATHRNNKPPDLSNHPFFQQTATVAAARDLAAAAAAAGTRGRTRARGGTEQQQQHDLLLVRLMQMQQEGKMAGAMTMMMQPPKKGRQRLKPRKKKFSALKKKVLEERLRKWRELHPTTTAAATTTTATTALLGSSSAVVVLSGYAEADELQDDDEYEEIQNNLLDMACKIGPVKRILIPRTLLQEEEDEMVVPSFVQFEEPNLAAAAVECWNDLVLGGNKLKARNLVMSKTDGMTEPPEALDDFERWCRNAMLNGDDNSPNGAAEGVEDSLHVVEMILENVLTEDDLEDEECLEESLADIEIMTSKLGNLESLRVERDPAPYVVLSYRCSEREANEIVEKLKKTVVGGAALVAGLRNQCSQHKISSLRRTIVLRNVLTEDDVGDEECLEESLNDLKEIANQFGSVVGMKADVEAGTVEVEFDTIESTETALGSLNGMVIGGTSITATMLNQESYEDSSKISIDPPAVEAEPTVMFSGEKRIPERFVECKRVPKIPNSGKPRNYAVMCDDDTAKPLLSEMLSELMRLQRRAIEDKNAKARRRLVMGLREVARGIRAHKVKLVAMANNLDEYGIIDEKLQEIIDMCVREEVPIFFEFSKRTLGKALGKSIKVAVVGVQNAEGAHQQFKKLVGLAPRLSSGIEA